MQNSKRRGISIPPQSSNKLVRLFLNLQCRESQTEPATAITMKENE